jgi:hypothetical protein
MAPLTAAAQSTSPVTFGLRAGVTSATVNGDDFSDAKQRWGVTGGLFVGREINEHVGLQIEGLLAQRGAEDISSDPAGTHVRLTYLDVPLLLRVGRADANGTGFHVFAGPQVGFKLDAEVTNDDLGETDDISDDVESVDFGVTFGVAVDIRRFVVDARYTVGLKNVNKIDDGKAKNRTFAVTAGFRFK